MWIVIVFIAFEFTAVIAVVGTLIRSHWFGLARQFPHKIIIEPSIRRNFQSFKIGSVGLGYSVHVIVDDEHLHLLPSAILRIFQCPPMSIPWDEMVLSKKQPVYKQTRNVDLGTFKLTGPAWCFELVPSSVTQNSQQIAQTPDL